jgi:protein involved in polysaccharide export with SLBB domain
MMRLPIVLLVSTVVVFSHAVSWGQTGSGQQPETNDPISQSQRDAGTTVIRSTSEPGARFAPPLRREPDADADRPLTREEAQSMTAGRSSRTPPSAQSEFQRFINKSTGLQLELFGGTFFQTATAPARSNERPPVPADYMIGPGDELMIRAWGSIEMDFTLTVDRAGQVNLPRIGTISVARLRAGEVESHIRSHIARIFKGFSLNVSLGQLRGIDIYVVGHAKRPGRYTVSALSSSLQGILASGGPSPTGSMRRIQLKRGKAVTLEMDLYEFISKGEKPSDDRLQQDDVIVFLASGPKVAVVGSTDAPAIYELKTGQETLAELFSLMGGTKATTDQSRGHLERIDSRNARSPRTVEFFSPENAGGVRLRDGDIVSLFPVELKYSNAITLRGNVARPLRHPHATGMKVSDLIPERDALITPDYFTRKNRLVQYFVTDENGRPIFDRGINEIKNLLDEPNWEYATIERLDDDKLNTKLIPFHLGKAILDQDEAHNLRLLPGDIVTIFGSKDIRTPLRRGSRLVRVEGEVDRPGFYQLNPGDTIKTLLDRAGGVSPQAYLFGTELTRVTTRERQRQALRDAVRRLENTLNATSGKIASNIASADAATASRLQAAEEEGKRQQLAKLRSLEPTGRIALELHPTIKSLSELPDLPLEDGDAIMIPSRPGFVFVLGAVSNDNAIIWRPERTVRDYLLLSGITPDADESNIFVARADGTIVHSRNRKGWFRGGLTSLDLAPGDTVVVPDLSNRETAWSAFVRGAKDWTQILSNFGLAAAAIKTLRN